MPTPRNRTVTMEDVAQRAHVSRALVSLVMRQRPNVSPASRARVLRAADELGYVPNGLASRLASRRTDTLGVLLLDLHNTVFADIHDGVVSGLAGTGVQTVLATGSTDRAAEAAALTSLASLQVDGIVVAGYTGDAGTLERFARAGPVVVATRSLLGPGVDCVLTDEHRGASLAVRHLLELGHRSILHIASPSSLPYPDRRRGYLETMAAAGCEPMVAEAEMTEAGGREAVRRCLAQGRRFTAVFANNDLAAVGAMEELRAAGLDVPRDISVVGFDCSDLARTSLIDLTTVDQQSRRIGELAARTFIERRDDADAVPGEERRVAPRIRRGRTTAPVP
jgi:DNA-binding LacI/PurR family transcriptional regulator